MEHLGYDWKAVLDQVTDVCFGLLLWCTVPAGFIYVFLSFSVSVLVSSSTAITSLSN